MTDVYNEIARGSRLALPELARTLDGFDFEPRADVWELRGLGGRQVFRFDNLTDVLGPEVLLDTSKHCCGR